jgi:hypothetical protein
MILEAAGIIDNQIVAMILKALGGLIGLVGIRGAILRAGGLKG